MSLKISHNTVINSRLTTRDGDLILSLNKETQPEDLYKKLGLNYAKFYKMDNLCRWAWLGAEILLHHKDGYVYDRFDKEKIAVVLCTSHGCLDADKKYNATIESFPSPGLFVYTLPNIMLGEISIRHGFKGEQMCLASDGFNSEEVHFCTQDVLRHRGMDACLCGWVDVTDNACDICLFWITKDDGKQAFTAVAMQELYRK